jgi:hypothetical protein
MPSGENIHTREFFILEAEFSRLFFEVSDDDYKDLRLWETKARPICETAGHRTLAATRSLRPRFWLMDSFEIDLFDNLAEKVTGCIATGI